MGKNFTYKIATLDDLKFTDEIEKQALPIIDPYYKENIDIFTSEIDGDLIMVYDGDYAVGMGRYSFHPDGTMWLETVRVRPDYQRLGIGTGIYENYLKKAKENNVKKIRLYTEDFNEKSMALTKKMGYKIILKYDYYSLKCPDGNIDSKGFKVEKDLDKVMDIIEKNPWQDLLCINNVFFEQNRANIGWFLDRDMVYVNGNDMMILGARHNRKSVSYIMYMTGDYEKIVDAAISLSPSKTLSIGISKNDKKNLSKYFKDFEKRYGLVVSEKNL